MLNSKCSGICQKIDSYYSQQRGDQVRSSTDLLILLSAEVWAGCLADSYASYPLSWVAYIGPRGNNTESVFQVIMVVYYEVALPLACRNTAIDKSWVPRLLPPFS